MKVIDCDITTIPFGSIVHAVNCKGSWGAGLAAQLKQRFPKAFQKYLYTLSANKNITWELLGCVDVYDTDDIDVLSCFTQYDVGVGRRRTEYSAVIQCFNEIRKIKRSVVKEPLYIPYKFGCGLGGGDWGIVEKIIERYVPSAIICKNE